MLAVGLDFDNALSRLLGDASRNRRMLQTMSVPIPALDRLRASIFCTTSALWRLELVDHLPEKNGRKHYLELRAHEGQYLVEQVVI